MAAREYLALSAACALAFTGAMAQSLEEPANVRHVMEAAQFGMPGDSKYVFCESESCPQHTKKTLAVPRRPIAHTQQEVTAPPAPAPAPVLNHTPSPDMPRSEAPPSRAKTKVNPRKPPRKKRASQTCRPPDK